MKEALGIPQLFIDPSVPDECIEALETTKNDSTLRNFYPRRRRGGPRGDCDPKQNCEGKFAVESDGRAKEVT
jgi:hypothetical protein